MKGLYFSDNSSTWIEYPGMVWLKLLPACTDDVTGTIRVGSVKVLVEASPRPVSDISLAVWPTEAEVPTDLFGGHLMSVPKSL